MATETVDTVVLAPIPVGHRVEIRWYAETVSGVFKASSKEHPYEPMLVDLDTGIEYVPEWLVSLGEGKRPKVPIGISRQPKAESTLVRTLIGKVVSCRVVSVNWTDAYLQTHLEVAVE